MSLVGVVSTWEAYVVERSIGQLRVRRYFVVDEDSDIDAADEANQFACDQQGVVYRVEIRGVIAASELEHDYGKEDQ